MVYNEEFLVLNLYEVLKIFLVGLIKHNGCVVLDEIVCFNLVFVRLEEVVLGV